MDSTTKKAITYIVTVAVAPGCGPRLEHLQGHQAGRLACPRRVQAAECGLNVEQRRHDGGRAKVARGCWAGLRGVAFCDAPGLWLRRPQVPHPVEVRRPVGGKPRDSLGQVFDGQVLVPLGGGPGRVPADAISDAGLNSGTTGASLEQVSPCMVRAYHLCLDRSRLAHAPRRPGVPVLSQRDHGTLGCGSALGSA
jgi:hypothetical protein